MYILLNVYSFQLCHSLCVIDTIYVHYIFTNDFKAYQNNSEDKKINLKPPILSLFPPCA